MRTVKTLLLSDSVSLTSGWEAVTLVCTLLGVIGLIFLVWYVLRSFSRYTSRSQGRNMEILERLVISNDKSLLLVRAGGQYLLVGVSPQHVELVAELDEADLSLLNAPAAFSPKKPSALQTPENGTFLENLQQAAKNHPWLRSAWRSSGQRKNSGGLSEEKPGSQDAPDEWDQISAEEALFRQEENSVSLPERRETQKENQDEQGE